MGCTRYNTDINNDEVESDIREYQEPWSGSRQATTCHGVFSLGHDMMRMEIDIAELIELLWRWPSCGYDTSIDGE